MFRPWSVWVRMHCPLLSGSARWWLLADAKNRDDTKTVETTTREIEQTKKEVSQAEYAQIMNELRNASQAFDDAAKKYDTVKETGDNDNNQEQWPASSFQFEISGTQQKFLHSFRTISIYSPPGRRAPYFGGLIGVTKDAVEGVDLDVAVSTFSETHYFPPEFVTTNYMSFINRAYGRVNGYSFRGYNADEVRFLGVSGSYKGSERWVELTYRFAVSPNMDGLWIGDIGPIWKPGWA